MSITERSDGIVRVAFNRPGKKNAMIGAMYTSLADIFNEANGDEKIRVVLWHGVGQSFCVGNDVEDFLKHPPRPGDCPQGRLIEALIRFEKPIVVVVQGAAIRAAIERRCGGAYIYQPVAVHRKNRDAHHTSGGLGRRPSDADLLHDSRGHGCYHATGQGPVDLLGP